MVNAFSVFFCNQQISLVIACPALTNTLEASSYMLRRIMTTEKLSVTIYVHL